MSQDILPFYSFLPWSRKGIATGISQRDHLGKGSNSTLERATLEVRAKVKDIGTKTVRNTVNILGPAGGGL